jgi:hypothetical protein
LRTTNRPPNGRSVAAARDADLADTGQRTTALRDGGELYVIPAWEAAQPHAWGRSGRADLCAMWSHDDATA